MTRTKPKSKMPVAILLIGVAAAAGLAFFLASGDVEAPTAPVSLTLTAEYTGVGHLRGPADAPVTLIEYGDFACPHCADFHYRVTELMRRMPDEVALEFRHFPIPVTANSLPAALAAEAAGAQGRYWEMHDWLFQTQSLWALEPEVEELFVSMAAQIGLDTDQFIVDMHSDEARERIDTDRARGSAMQINSTPTVFVNGEYLEDSSASVEVLEALVRSAMGE